MYLTACFKKMKFTQDIIFNVVLLLFSKLTNNLLVSKSTLNIGEYLAGFISHYFLKLKAIFS